MAQREGSIYLYLFIVACVLFMVMTVLFFINNAEKQDLISERDALDGKLKQKDSDIKKLSSDISELKLLVAGPNASEEWSTDIAQFVKHFMEDELKGKAEKAVNEVATDLKEAQKTYTYLVEPFTEMPVLFQKLRQARDDAAAKRTAAEQAQLQSRQGADTEVAKLREELKGGLQKIQDLEAKYEDLDNKAKAREAELVSQVDTERDKGLRSTVDLNRKLNYSENKIRSLQTRIDELLRQAYQEKQFDEVEADGKIEHVAGEVGKVWINLGRNDHLMNGLKFRVFQIVKGGKKQYKGSIEVRKVDEATSEAKIVEEADPLNPIVRGDIVSSPFYARDEQPIFVFAGSQFESPEVTKEFVIEKMKKSGCQVSDKVDVNTDFLVAMKDFENTPEYKTARELGVTVIRERDLLGFIGQ